MNTPTLLLLSFVLFISCDKATDAHTASRTTFIAGDTAKSDSMLKGRYLIIEDSVDFYVEKLENIEERYYANNVTHDELLLLSLEGLALQEKLTAFLKNTINENIENPLGIYLLAVYSELFSVCELQALIKRIPPCQTELEKNFFME